MDRSTKQKESRNKAAIAEYRDLKKRYAGIDLLRIAAALVVCAFHTRMHLNCNYYFLMGVVSVGSVFMTLFFLISGFSLFVNWSGTDLTEIPNMKTFWKKRFLSVAPMYYLAAAAYIIMQLVLKEDTIETAAVLFPIEAAGLQNVFSSLFGYSHNGGTWFISCILICYLIYPFLQEIITRTTTKTHLLLLAACFFSLLYAPLAAEHAQVSEIYSNPFFRLLEFFAGMILAAMKKDLSGRKWFGEIVYNWITIIVIGLILCYLLHLVTYSGTDLGKFVQYMKHNWICLPCFSVLLLGLSGVRVPGLEKTSALPYMSKLTYAFFLAQLFSNRLARWLINTYSIYDNKVRILLGFGVCVIITMILQFVESGIKKAFTHKRERLSNKVP